MLQMAFRKPIINLPFAALSAVYCRVGAGIFGYGPLQTSSRRRGIVAVLKGFSDVGGGARRWEVISNAGKGFNPITGVSPISP
ncbi:hypothetical protein SDJN02_11021, partial [Cucurbita argyrosperma subsp. argyrosperma]